MRPENPDGFIEPHFFAGFSGGGKALIPGMGGQDTVLRNHDAGMIGDPGAAWGVTWGNPIWEEIHEAAGYVESLPAECNAEPGQADYGCLRRRPGPGARGRLRVRARDGHGAGLALTTS